MGKAQANKAPGGCCGCLALILLIGWIASLVSPAPEDTEIGAFLMSQEFVLQALKAPATADFPNYSEGVALKVSDRTYLVISYVDAENSFGAKIRNYYTCKLTYVGDSKWRLDDLQIE